MDALLVLRVSGEVERVHVTAEKAIVLFLLGPSRILGFEVGVFTGVIDMKVAEVLMGDARMGLIQTEDDLLPAFVKGGRVIDGAVGGVIVIRFA